MIWLTAIILGIVEGLTEFLPVSSTGHLILATELLGYDASKWAVFNIAIQPGAILAIVVLYRHLFWDMFVGLFRRDPIAIAFVRNLLLARSEEHTSELQSLMRISYAVFCLKKQQYNITTN